MTNRRKTVVINKKFQYQQALMTVAVTVLLVNSFLIFRMFVPDDSSAALSSSLLYAIAAIELLLIVSVWYGSLKSSHRIAGPVFVITREIGKLGRGDFSAQIRLRKKDMFLDMAEEMNASLELLRNRIKAIKDAAAAARCASSGSDETEVALASLYEQIDQLRTEEQP